MRYTPVLNILGILLAILAATMLLPMMADIVTGSSLASLAISALATGFVGVGLFLAHHNQADFDIGLRQAFLLTNGAWLSIGLFGALPFLLSDLDLSVSDSVFEAMSGITTTGSTILPMIERASAGILLWRALLQWLAVLVLL